MAKKGDKQHAADCKCSDCTNTPHVSSLQEWDRIIKASRG